MDESARRDVIPVTLPRVKHKLYNSCMKSKVLVACMALASASAHAAESPAKIRSVILSARHLGVHGMGYNMRSMEKLSKRLSADDIPVLITLASRGNDVLVGAQFALAAQCDPAIPAVHDAAVRHKIDFLDAEDTLSLMAGFEGCSQESQAKASAMQETLRQLHAEESAPIARESKQKAEDDARIQRNGLKLLDPEQAKTLTHEERMEIYRRSLAAMGLSENGPMTPDQEKIADRMYRSMVLDEVRKGPLPTNEFSSTLRLTSLLFDQHNN
jgi:hypothetical protein